MLATLSPALHAHETSPTRMDTFTRGSRDPPTFTTGVGGVCFCKFTWAFVCVFV
jgi:hypothetical protein